MNVKWYSESIDSVENILKTNAACGLSRKAARSRIRKTGGNSFFFVGTKSVAACVRAVLSDPMLLLLFGVDIVAAVFGETAVAITAGVLILLNLIPAFVSYIKSQRIIESMSGYSQPKVRVIRDGTLFLADSRCIVPGDVILLSAGDVLPCDARIVGSEGLKVSLFTGKNSDKPYITVVPDADARYTEESNLEFYEFKNMLYAGSAVLCGEVRAIAVETGDSTYIGVTDGGIPLNDDHKPPELLLEMKRFSRIYSFAVLLMILPLTVIGIFSYGTDRMLNTFMLTLSLAVSSLGELMYVIGNIITASSLINCAAGKGKTGGAMIKSTQSVSALAETDRLLLFGDAALTDGKYRCVAVYANAKLLTGKEIFEGSALRTAEYAVMLAASASAFPAKRYVQAGAFPNGFDAFVERVGVDRESIGIRSVPLSFTYSDRQVATVNDGGRILTLTAARTSDVLDACVRETVGGEVFTLSSERRGELKRRLSEFAVQGCLAYAITVRPTGESEIFEGILVFKRTVSPAVSAKIAELKTAGVETLLFLDGEGYAETAAALESGIAENRSRIAYASAFSGKNIAQVAENYTAFLGFTSAQIKSVADTLKSKGHTVALFASEMKNYPEADLLLTCDRAEYHTGKDDFERLEVSTPSGVSDSPDGVQLLRISADVLVKRAGHKGGGVEGICNAIAASRVLQRNLVRAVSYLLTTQALRLAIVIPAMLFGISVLSPFQLLFSGLLLDLGAVFVFAFDRSTETVMSEKYRPLSLKRPLKLFRDRLLTALISAGAGAVSAIIISLAGKCAVGGAVFVSLVVTQLIILYTTRFDSIKAFRETGIGLSVLLSAIAAVLLCALIPPLATVTGTVISPLSLICLPVVPLAYIVIGYIFRRKRTE